MKICLQTITVFLFRIILLSILPSSKEVLGIESRYWILLCFCCFHNCSSMQSLWKYTLILQGIKKKNNNKRQNPVICVAISFCWAEQNGFAPKCFIICGVFHKSSIYHLNYIIGNAVVYCDVVTVSFYTTPGLLSMLFQVINYWC